jgi:dienelactone hydrolase
MNIKPTSTLITAGLSLAITLAACGGSTSNHGATKTTTRASAPATATTSPPAGSSSLLPEPSGPYPVGVRTVPDVAPDATTRLWYPARRGTGTGTPEYLDRASVAKLGLTMSQAARVHPRASVDAVPAPTTKARPTVVLMPGWGNPMAVSTALAQDLASNGYVVVAIDPTPGTEDGNTMPADSANPARRFDQVGAGIDFVTGGQISALAGPVDKNRIAAGGHSIAGAVAYQVALTDPRVHAVFDLDGWLHGPALTTPVKVPALMINASGLEPATKAVIARTPKAVTVQLAGATHGDVTDLPCIAPALGSMASVLGLGTIGCTGTTTSSTLVRRFLDAVLKHTASTPSAATLSSGLHGMA